MRLVNAGEIVACRVGGNGKWIIDRNSIDSYFVEGNAWQEAQESVNCYTAM